LDQLGIISGEALRNFGQGEVSWHSVQQELAKAFSDLHSLTFSIVGERVLNDRSVVFVYNIVLGVAGREDDVAADRDTCTDKRRCKDVLVINNCGVDMAERGVCGNLACGVVLLSVDDVHQQKNGKLKYIAFFTGET